MFVSSRYELSETLRAFFPNMCEDPTEEEVLLGMWTYVVSNGLIEGREKKVIRCDPAMRKLYSADTFVASSLKHRLRAHTTPAKLIKFDYILSPDTAVDLDTCVEIFGRVCSLELITCCVCIVGLRRVERPSMLK
jgi:chromatin remodeling complex protein RSC6